MEKSSRIVANVYGYAVCLVSVIVILISTTALVTAIIDLGDPLHSGWSPQGAPSLASFENYKLDVMRSIQKGNESGTQTYIPTESTLQSMYEAAKNEKIQSSRHQSNRSILISSMLMVIAIILFIVHWTWMKRIARTA